jgi:lysophospholipase L1-like esterase
VFAVGRNSFGRIRTPVRGHYITWYLLHNPKFCDDSSVSRCKGTNDEANAVSAEGFATTLHDFTRRLLHLFRTSLRSLCVIVSKLATDPCNLLITLTNSQHPFPDFTELEPSVLASSIPAVLDRIREESEEVSLHDFDIATAMSLGLTHDGLHPTIEGHKVLGQNLAGQLGAILSRLDTV